jgi:hypothetical protein
MKKIFLILSIITLLTTSCKHKEFKTYYNTGELGAIVKYINDSVFCFKSYYKNGNFEINGFYKKITDTTSVPFGHWTCYFADGMLYYDCEFSNDGFPLIPVNDSLWNNIDSFTNPLEVHIEVEEKSPLIAGQIINFRVIVPQVHPDLYVVLDSNYVDIPKNLNTQLAFPYTIKPEKSGRYVVQIIFKGKDGYFILGERNITFSIEVE